MWMEVEELEKLLKLCRHLIVNVWSIKENLSKVDFIEANVAGNLTSLRASLVIFEGPVSSAASCCNTYLRPDDQF